VRQERGLAVSALTLTASAIAAWASFALRAALRRAERIDSHLSDAQVKLNALVDREAADRAEELERILARARADSVSLLVDEERKIAEERRAEFAEREREVVASLTESLTATQAQVEQRHASWAQDLDRAAETTKSRIGALAVPDVVPRLSATPGEIRWLGEGIGAQNDEIFRDLLGLSDGDIRQMRDDGVI